MKTNLEASRDQRVDLGRSFAVLLMILCHTVRGIQFASRPEWTGWLLAIEPLAQVLFLFLLGASAWLSRECAGGGKEKNWILGQARRCLGLLLLAALMVLLERGHLQEPVQLFSGFLGLAAKSLLILAPLGFLPADRQRRAGGVILALALGGVAAALEMNGVWVNGVNAGSGPVLPLAAVSAVGWVWASCTKSRRWIWVGMGLLLALVSWMGWGASGLGVWLADSGRESVGVWFEGTQGAVRVFYYTLHCGLGLFWCGWTLLLLDGLGLAKGWVVRWAAPLGRHTLTVYLVHLAVLGILRLRFGFLEGSFFYPLAVVLFILMVLLSHIMDWYRRKKVFIIGAPRIRSSVG